MKAAIFYATREGQTRRIADRIAADLRHHGTTTDVFDVRRIGPIDWNAYSTVCVAASVHGGHH